MTTEEREETIQAILDWYTDKELQDDIAEEVENIKQDAIDSFIAYDLEEAIEGELEILESEAIDDERERLIKLSDEELEIEYENLG